MSDNITADFNGALFIENRNKFPREEWLRHAGRYVAWSSDGTKIVASGAALDELFANLQAADIKLNSIVQSYVPGPDEDTLL
jgi:hypothetical protein